MNRKLLGVALSATAFVAGYQAAPSQKTFTPSYMTCEGFQGNKYIPVTQLPKTDQAAFRACQAWQVRLDAEHAKDDN